MVDVKDCASLIISRLLSRYQTTSDNNLKIALLPFVKNHVQEWPYHSEYHPVGCCVVHTFC